ncbi:B-cell receptor-associated protein 29 [Erpetoichthys calabaricus]|uniref:Endoplasmic reticulum transmembrane protein n=1 Tax=Erpetoichthys calabaricus TaxID=27687 RepID=A0A8C4RNG7_ERPCA|nr:B-cell receptor-associated protein 29 [Erpetoichthys calabaricus]XP_028668862.1 B-cell receptor-associated protein 29 [Erpetoichthys calabaricus]
MTLQWTAVATFLYIEIGILLFLCLPFISAVRWQKIFRFRIWECIAPYWNKGFLTMIIVLIVLFIDAVREVRKYSGAEANKETKLHPNMFDHLHMKLFRAQRNLYISGFSLFLWLMLRRVVTLITLLANTQETRHVLKTQAEMSEEAIKKYKEENEYLRKTLEIGKVTVRDTNFVAEHNMMKNEVEELKTELEKTSQALKKSTADSEVIRMETHNITREYDRLLVEYAKLQNQVEEKSDKKAQ